MMDLNVGVDTMVQKRCSFYKATINSEPKMILQFRKKLFAVIAENPYDYLEDFCPNNDLISSLRGKADVLAFRERSWCMGYDDLPFSAKVCKDNVAVLEFDDYDDWFKHVKSETRTAIRRAYKHGISVKILENAKIYAEPILAIYNETPIRQGRRFSHYGSTEEILGKDLVNSQTVLIGAFYNEQLVGYVKLLYGDCTGLLSQILSLIAYRNLPINNALIAKAIEICSSKGLNWLVYARMGNHPTLDAFKRNNGFRKVNIKRIFIPLSKKGKLLLALGLQRELKDSVPSFLKPLGFRIYNFVSKMKMKI